MNARNVRTESVLEKKPAWFSEPQMSNLSLRPLQDGQTDSKKGNTKPASFMMSTFRSLTARSTLPLLQDSSLTLQLTLNKQVI